MTARNLDIALSKIFGHEGGYTSARSDPGNWTGGKIGKGKLKGTKYGISAQSYPHLDIRNLTLAKATEIYRRDYAKKIRFDDLPAGVDYATFDFAINSGTSRAAKFLQNVVGVEQDGVIGPATLTAVRAFDPAEIITQLCDDRLAFMQSLKRMWPIYGKGWERRVTEVRAFSLKLAEEQPKPKPVIVAPEPTEGWGTLITLLLRLIQSLFAPRR